jgi:transcriptional regulator with XRE-family HTH domain
MQNESPLRWVRREVFGADQEEIAAIGGVSRSRVSRYEGGSPLPYAFMHRLRTEALARGLSFTADWFFDPPNSVAGQKIEREGGQ